MSADTSPTPPVPDAGREGAVRLFRRVMWGFLFFLPIVNVYLDVAGWLVLLLALSAPGLERPARSHPRALAIAGLMVSTARIALVAAGALTLPFSEAMFLSFSLLIAAALLWELCQLIIAISKQAGDHVLPRQARVRSLGYVVYALLPFSLSAVGRALTPAAGLAVLVAYVVAGAAVTTLVMALLANAANLCRAAALGQRQSPAE